MDDREYVARTMRSLLVLTESLLAGMRYTGADLERARGLVARVHELLDKSNALRKSAK
jgi:hypothetical protein